MRGPRVIRVRMWHVFVYDAKVIGGLRLVMSDSDKLVAALAHRVMLKQGEDVAPLRYSMEVVG